MCTYIVYSEQSCTAAVLQCNISAFRKISTQRNCPFSSLAECIGRIFYCSALVTSMQCCILHTLQWRIVQKLCRALQSHSRILEGKQSTSAFFRHSLGILWALFRPFFQVPAFNKGYFVLSWFQIFHKSQKAFFSYLGCEASDFLAGMGLMLTFFIP